MQNIKINLISLFISFILNINISWATTYKLPIINLDKIKSTQIYSVKTTSIPSVDIMILMPNVNTNNSCVSEIANTLIGKKFIHISEEKTLTSLQDMGAEFALGISEDYFSIKLRSLNSEQSKAFEWLFNAMYKSDITAEIFYREQKNYIQKLQEQNKQPAIIAMQNLKQQVFGNQHIYAKNCSIQQAQNVTLDAVKDYYAEQILSMPLNKAKIVAVGNIDSKDVKHLIENTFFNQAKLSTITNYKNFSQFNQNNNFNETQIPTLPNIYTAYLDVVQANVRMGIKFITRDNSDIFNLLIANYILGGGGFNSRLMEQIRERNGFVYGISSTFSPLKQQGIFTIDFQTKQEQLEIVNDLVYKVLVEFVNNGVKNSEIQQAKKFLLQSFSFRLDSNEKWLAQLVIIAWYNLPLNYLNTWQDNIQKTNLNSINIAIKKNFDLNQLKISIVKNKI